MKLMLVNAEKEVLLWFKLNTFFAKYFDVLDMHISLFLLSSLEFTGID